MAKPGCRLARRSYRARARTTRARRPAAEIELARQYASSAGGAGRVRAWHARAAAGGVSDRAGRAWQKSPHETQGGHVGIAKTQRKHPGRARRRCVRGRTRSSCVIRTAGTTTGDWVVMRPIIRHSSAGAHPVRPGVRRRPTMGLAATHCV